MNFSGNRESPNISFSGSPVGFYSGDLSNGEFGENIDAQTALQWGVVNEVVPHEQAYARGVEIATKLAGKPAFYGTAQKQTLNQALRRRIIEGVPYGMALEGLTAANMAYLES